MSKGWVAVVVVFLVLSAVPGGAADKGLYIGGSLGGSSFDVMGYDEALGDIDFSDSDAAYKLFAGYRFLGFFAVEAGYVDLGEPGESLAENVRVDIDVQGWDAFAVGMLPIGPVDLFAKVGGVSWTADIRAAFDDVTDSDSDSGTDLAYGLGIALRLGSLAVRVEGEQFDLDNADEVYLFTAGVTLTF